MFTLRQYLQEVVDRSMADLAREEGVDTSHPGFRRALVSRLSTLLDVEPGLIVVAVLPPSPLHFGDRVEVFLPRVSMSYTRDLPEKGAA